MEKSLADSIMHAAARQMQQQVSMRPNQADLLVREMLDFHTNANSRIELRDWVREARRYIVSRDRHVA